MAVDLFCSPSALQRDPRTGNLLWAVSPYKCVGGWDNVPVQPSDVCASPEGIQENTNTEDCGAGCEDAPECAGVAASKVVAIDVYTTDSKLWER
jgi:hypothetical protein